MARNPSEIQKKTEKTLESRFLEAIIHLSSTRRPYTTIRRSRPVARHRVPGGEDSVSVAGRDRRIVFFFAHGFPSKLSTFSSGTFQAGQRYRETSEIGRETTQRAQKSRITAGLKPAPTRISRRGGFQTRPKCSNNFANQDGWTTNLSFLCPLRRFAAQSSGCSFPALPLFPHSIENRSKRPGRFLDSRPRL